MRLAGPEVACVKNTKVGSAGSERTDAFSPKAAW
jgi:hypothetical protein